MIRMCDPSNANVPAEFLEQEIIVYLYKNLLWLERAISPSFRTITRVAMFQNFDQTEWSNWMYKNLLW